MIDSDALRSRSPGQTGEAEPSRAQPDMSSYQRKPLAVKVNVTIVVKSNGQIEQGSMRLARQLSRHLSCRFLSDSAASRAVDKVQDVQGGKIGEEPPEEGKLYVAERAKNIIAANQRFQLSTYRRVPEDLADTGSVHTDSRHPVFGKLHQPSSKTVIYLRQDHASDVQHMQNVEKLASSSILTGHIDPVGLVPIFTRVGLKPPVSAMVGDLIPVETAFLEEVHAMKPSALQKVDVKAYWFDWSIVQYIDVFDKKRQISPRDFRGAFVDYLAEEQHKVIHLANTKYLDILPSFCKFFLGVPVDDAYLYSVDRIGMSIFGLRSGTDSMWREYRFPFTREIRTIDDLEKLFEQMIADLPADQKP